MQKTLTIADSGRILREIDRYQISRMIAVKMAPFREQIQSVVFRVYRIVNHDLKHEYLAQVTVLLSSGHRLSHDRADLNLQNCLISLTDEMRLQLGNAASQYARWSDRTLTWITERSIQAIRQLTGRPLHRTI